MMRYLALLSVPLQPPATPASALTAKRKMKTCQIGAKAQKRTGAKRKAFIRRCMAHGSYVPKACKQAKKHVNGNE